MPFDKFSNRRKDRRDIEKPEAKKPLVLVIDDDPTILKALGFNLSQKYNVRLYDSGEAGIKAIDDDVRVVILDIKMPDKNGFMVYDEIKENFPELPIIFYSAFQNLLESLELRQKYKPFDYLDKSGKPEKLFECIEEAIKYYENIFNLAKATRRLRNMK